MGPNLPAGCRYTQLKDFVYTSHYVNSVALIKIWPGNIITVHQLHLDLVLEPRLSTPVALIKAIDHVQRVARDPRYIIDPTVHTTLYLPIDVTEPIQTRVLVGQSSADPRFHVTHLRLERPDPEVLQLLQSPPQIVHRFRYLLHTVTQCDLLPLAATMAHFGW